MNCLPDFPRNQTQFRKSQRSGDYSPKVTKAIDKDGTE